VEAVVGVVGDHLEVVGVAEDHPVVEDCPVVEDRLVVEDHQDQDKQEEGPNWLEIPLKSTMETMTGPNYSSCSGRFIGA